MTLRSDRRPDGGFTLLEALVAFGLLTLVLATALPALSGAAARQAMRLNRLYAAEFAVSVLEEYRATYPVMAPKGSDSSGWAWEIDEAKVAPDGITSLAPAMQLFELRLEVWHHERPSERQRFGTIVARPAP